MAFTKIGDILNHKFGKSAVGQKVTAALVCEEFDKLMLQVWGKKIENMAKAMYLKDKILTIACLSPVAAQELTMKQGELIRKINHKFGQEIVERLRFLT